MKFQILTVALAVLGVAAADEAPRRRGLAKTGAKGTDASPLAREMAKRIKLRKSDDEDDCDEETKKKKKSKNGETDPTEPPKSKKKKCKDDKKSKKKKDDDDDDDDTTKSSKDFGGLDDRLHRGICAEDKVEKSIEKEYCDECEGSNDVGSFCQWLNDDSPPLPPVANDPSLYVYEAYDAEDFHEQVKEIMELIEAEAGGLASKKEGGGDEGGEKKEKKEKKEEKKEKKEEKKEKKEEKKKSKKKKDDDDDDDYSSKSSKDDDDDFTSFDNRSLEPVAYKGYIATRDMCDDPIGPNIQDVCDEIYDGLCSDPKTASDEDFCDFAGFGPDGKRKKSSKSAKYAYQLRG